MSTRHLGLDERDPHTGTRVAAGRHRVAGCRPQSHPSPIDSAMAMRKRPQGQAADNYLACPRLFGEMPTSTLAESI
jgi:hypothetical protein